MNIDEHEYLHKVRPKVIGAAFEVSNQLGVGFLEKVYETALLHELQSQGLKASGQKKINVYYKDVYVGEYIADIVVENCLIIELKCVEAFAPEHTVQCLNYLRVTELKLALLLNFQRPKVEIKRIIF